MNSWMEWIREIAYDRIDQIERHLNASPEAYPEFTAAAGKLDAAMDETDAHPDAKLTERDELWMTYSAALALEIYLAGTRDGGRVYHAFITHIVAKGRILEYLGQKETISSVKVQKLCGYNKDQAYRILTKLCEDGILYKTGIGRGTKYYLCK